MVGEYHNNFKQINKIAEIELTQPINVYGKSKLQGERIYTK